MPKETIHQDVSGAGSDRMNRMNALAKNFQKGREEYLKTQGAYRPVGPVSSTEEEHDEEEVLDNPQDEDQENKDPPVEDEQGEEEDLPGDEDGDRGEPAPVYLKDGVWVTKTKVNGVEQEVAFTKVLATAQKQEAADLRLREASDRLREVERREAQLQDAQKRAQPPAEGVEAVSEESLKKLARDYNQALIDGKDDEAAELLLKITTTGRQSKTTLNVDAIADTAAAKAAQQLTQNDFSKQVEAAKSRFKTEFADVAGDPVLWDLADRYTLEISTEEPGLSPYEVMAKAGERARDWLKAKTTAQGMQSRQDRKRQIAQSGGKSAGAKVKVGVDPAPPKTRKDVINDLRKARNQPTY